MPREENISLEYSASATIASPSFWYLSVYEISGRDKGRAQHFIVKMYLKISLGSHPFI